MAYGVPQRPELEGPPGAAARTVPLTGLRIVAGAPPEQRWILDGDALAYLVRLTRRFAADRERILRDRALARSHHREGAPRRAPPAERELRDPGWTVARLPSELEGHGVELTGGVDRWSVLRGLNARAGLFVADFEDLHSPTWAATLQGHINLADAVHRSLEVHDDEGQRFRLVSRPAALMVRPRGWHLVEGHLLLDGRAVPASFFDFAVYVSHNARELRRRGSGLYFQLAGLEHAAEARLWSDVFRFTEEDLGVPRGSIRASVTVDTVPAALELDGILHALRFHSAGLVAHRWAYLFSFIKWFQERPEAVLPERRALTTDTPILASYYRRIVTACQRRRAWAIGEIAVDPPPANGASREVAEAAGVEREALAMRRLGFDAISASQPCLVPLLEEWFVPAPMGEGPVPEDPDEDLLAAPIAPMAEPASVSDVQANVRRTLAYLTNWFQGVGNVAVDGRPEDTSSVELARAQLWQWVHHPTPDRPGAWVTSELVRRTVREETHRLVGDDEAPTSAGRAAVRSAQLLDELVNDPEPVEQFALRAYNDLERTYLSGGIAPHPRRPA